jgi:putative transposase
MQSKIAPRSRFLDKLKWKCKKFGSRYIEVDARYTTQTCCKCGKLHHLTIKDRTMICDCGNILDRDINAAINIKNRAEQMFDSNG